MGHSDNIFRKVSLKLSSLSIVLTSVADPNPDRYSPDPNPDRDSPDPNPDRDSPDPHVLGLLDPDPDPFVRVMDLDPDPVSDPDPTITKQK